MPIHSLTQNVTGSVALSEQAGVLLNSGSVTGLLVGGQPLSSANPLPISGSVSVSIAVQADGDAGATGSLAPVSASLMGGVNGGGLLQPITLVGGGLVVTGSVLVSNFPAVQVVSASNWIPTVTGSVVVANRVDVSGSNWIPQVTGSVRVENTVQVAGTLAVTQGTSPWIVSGSNWIPTVTGSVVVANRVDTRNLATSASVVFVSGGVNANVTVAANNAARAGLTLYNDTNKIAYVKLGVSASLIDYTTQMAKDDYYEIPFGYTGRIDVFTPAATVGVIRITELV